MQRKKTREDAKTKLERIMTQKGLDVDTLLKSDPNSKLAKSCGKLAGGAIRITREMIERVLFVLEQQNVEFVVAPYEADAQLAYMCRKGELHAVISEDSDLLVYGCPRLICKLDKYGYGQMIEVEQIVGEKNVLPVPAECTRKLEAASKAIAADL